MTPAGGESSGGNPPSTPYSEANSADPADVDVKADGIKVPYDVNDPVYWFRRLEVRMQTVGIGSQFWKRVALEQSVPEDIPPIHSPSKILNRLSKTMLRH